MGGVVTGRTGDLPARIGAGPAQVQALDGSPVASALQAGQLLRILGPNLVAVDCTGRTFFEIRQILRTVCLAEGTTCPPGVACTLEELDGHAHR